MAYVETVFGHQDSVLAIDAMMKERAVSVGGRDNTVRVWKIVEESQLQGEMFGSRDVEKYLDSHSRSF